MREIINNLGNILSFDFGNQKISMNVSSTGGAIEREEISDITNDNLTLFSSGFSETIIIKDKIKF